MEFMLKWNRLTPPMQTSSTGSLIETLDADAILGGQVASVKLVERCPGWWGWRTWCAGDLWSPLGPPEQRESPDQRLDQPEQDEEGHAQVHAVDAAEAAHDALQVILGN